MTHSQTVKRFIQIYYDYVSVVCFSESQSNKLFLLLCLFVRYSANRHFQEEMENIRQKQGGKLSKCRINHHYGFPLRKKKGGKAFYTYIFASLFFPTHPLAFQMSRRLDLHQSHTGVRDQAVFETLINNQ